MVQRTDRRLLALTAQSVHQTGHDYPEDTHAIGNAETPQGQGDRLTFLHHDRNDRLTGKHITDRVNFLPSPDPTQHPDVVIPSQGRGNDRVMDWEGEHGSDLVPTNNASTCWRPSRMATDWQSTHDERARRWPRMEAAGRYRETANGSQEWERVLHVGKETHYPTHTHSTTCKGAQVCLSLR